MKTLLMLFTICTLSAPASGDWSHRVTEGEGGGINANYFLFQTFRPDYGDGILMSVQRVRAIYALDRKGDVLVVDYFLGGGIRVVEMWAAQESLNELIAGRDVQFKNTSEFSIEAETSVGYLTPKTQKSMSVTQRQRILNLVYILSMQRSPIESEQDGAGQPPTAPESKSEVKEKPEPEAEGRSQ